MNKPWLCVAALMSLLSLSGCKEEPAPQVHANWLSLPALPIIQDAVLSLSPTFGGQRNAAVMGQVCGLARGEVSQDQANIFLSDLQMDAATLPKQGHEYSLLVNGDQAAQKTACAAYLATTVLTAVDISEFVRPSENTESAGEGDKAEKQSLEIDKERLAGVLPAKLAAAKANADVFALIAAEMQRRHGLSVSEYQDLAKQLFKKLAPTYLERIKTQLPPTNSRYQLVQLDMARFAFISLDTNTLFEFDAQGLKLRQNDVLWYGQGKLLGRYYPLAVAYFDDSVGELLRPKPQPTE